MAWLDLYIEPCPIMVIPHESNTLKSQAAEGPACLTLDDRCQIQTLDRSYNSLTQTRRRNKLTHTTARDDQCSVVLSVTVTDEMGWIVTKALKGSLRGNRKLRQRTFVDLLRSCILALCNLFWMAQRWLCRLCHVPLLTCSFVHLLRTLVSGELSGPARLAGRDEFRPSMGGTMELEDLIVVEFR